MLLLDWVANVAAVRMLLYNLLPQMALRIPLNANLAFLLPELLVSVAVVFVSVFRLWLNQSSVGASGMLNAATICGRWLKRAGMCVCTCK